MRSVVMKRKTLAEPPIIHRARIETYELPVEITLKDGTFTLKDTSGGDYPENGEDLRYGRDGYEIAFYKNGAIKKLGIGEKTARDCTLSCSLGEVFIQGGRPFPLMFWEDGSLKQCTVDDVMQVEVYGKKVQIPVGGLLRFQRDGSVWAYTTDQKISYIIGKETYTANDTVLELPEYSNTFDTVVLDEKGSVEQLLDPRGTKFLVQSFYPSGEIKKCVHDTYFMLGNKEGYVHIYYSSYDHAIHLRVELRDSTKYGHEVVYETFIGQDVYMLYFGDDGFPSSYDAIQPISGVTPGNLAELRIDSSFLCLTKMSEDDEFIVSKERIRNLKFIESY